MLPVGSKLPPLCGRFESRMNDFSGDSPSTSGTAWQLVTILDGAFTLQIAGAALAFAMALRMGGGNPNLLLEDAAR